MTALLLHDGRRIHLLGAWSQVPFLVSSSCLDLRSCNGSWDGAVVVRLRIVAAQIADGVPLVTSCGSSQETVGNILTVLRTLLLRLNRLLQVLDVDSQVNSLIMVARLPFDGLSSVLDAEDGPLLHPVVVHL